MITLSLGIDPGPSNTGICLLDVGGTRPLWLESHVAKSPTEAKRWIDALTARHPHIYLVTVERPAAMHDGNGANRTVIDTAVVAGELYEFCAWADRTYVTPQSWRAGLIGSFKSGSQDDLVKRTLKAICDGLPKRSTTHERDAGGCAIIGARVARLRRSA
jgi:hypothetical protein